jgi:CHAT domain-containing protein
MIAAVSRLGGLPLCGLIFLLFVTMWAGGCDRDGDRQAKRKLEHLLARTRPSEGRLVGAPWRKVTPPGLQQAPSPPKGSTRGSGLPAENPTPVRVSREGAVANLLAGRVDAAIAELSKAAALKPANAILWSDLAAAHLQRGAAASDPYELVLALSAANHAVHSDPALVAARFNRALAMERLTLRDPAAAEWRLVLKLEQDSHWKEEDRQHLSLLDHPVSSPEGSAELASVKALVTEGKTDQVRAVVAGSEQAFREGWEAEFFASWVAAESQHRAPEAAAQWTLVRTVANALAATGGDRMPADLVAQVEQFRGSDPDKLRRLLPGFVAYFEGLTLQGKPSASARLQAARRILEAEGSPLALWARYWIARGFFFLQSYSQARAQLDALTKDPQSFPYQAVRGKALSLAALIDGIEGRQTSSSLAYKAAVAAFNQVKETPAAAKASGNLAADLGVVGQTEEAWRMLVPTLNEPTTYGSPQVRANLYSNGSELAQQQDETEIALWFQEASVSQLQRLGQADGIVSGLCKKAALLAALGNRVAAAADLATSRRLLEQIAKTAPPELAGDVLLAEAQLAAGTPQLAIQKLDAAIPILRDASNHYRMGQALILRAGAKQALGENDGAESDLNSAIAEIEAQRETISEPNERISYLDRQRDIFNTMIGFQLERRGKAEAALAFSEQAKARMLWDWIMTGPDSEPDPALAQRAVSPELDLPSLRATLPPNTALIEYAVLPRKTILWIFRDDGEAPQAVTVDVTEKALADLVQGLRHALDNGVSAEIETLSQQLYRLLIQPLSSFLAPGERLVLIPDGALHMLPFALLRDRQTGHYLVQDHALTMAPSARVYAESRRHDREMALRPRRGALVIAAPDFDHDIDPSLAALRAGDTDAAIAQVIPGSRVLREGTATRRAFLRSAGDFGIVHFGGHSVVNTESPLLSQMLFAKSPEDPNRGVLHSGEILEQRFPHTRLMALASCATAAGRVSRTEGVESLAQPFLAAGVPAVVASLWSVGDQGTADFFQRFYRHLAKSSDAPGALQATQLDFLAQRPGAAVDARIWGAFEVIGGGMSQGNPP